MNGPDDDMDEAYRRASADDATRPSAATRAAILAQARRVAAEQRPLAANEPWFRRRSLTGIAASVAVIGIAAMLWRQSARDPEVPTAAAPAAVATDVAPPPAPAAPSPSRSLPLQAEAPAADQSARESRLGSAAATRSLNRAEASAKPSVAIGTRALVEREFPGLLQATEPPRALWLLLDANGQTLRTGRLDGGDFDALAARLRQELPNRRIDAFERETVATDNGISVEVGIARAR